MSDAATFRSTREGWLRATPSAETLEWAQWVLAEGDKSKPNDMRNFSNRRFQGFVAECAFHRWLERELVDHIWNGSTDPKPDFELGAAGVGLPTGVGLKSCGSESAWRPSHVVNVYERHREHSPQELFFVGFEQPGAVRPNDPTVVLLGGLPAATYFKLAEFVPKGGMLNPIVRAENDVWNLRTRELEPPRQWLDRNRPPGEARTA